MVKWQLSMLKNIPFKEGKGLNEMLGSVDDNKFPWIECQRQFFAAIFKFDLPCGYGAQEKLVVSVFANL